MSKETNEEKSREKKERLFVDVILSRVEFLLRIAVPIVATVFLIIQIFIPMLMSNDTVLKLILLIVAALSISEGINKFLSINRIRSQLDNIQNQNLPESIIELRKSVDKIYTFEIPNQKLLESAYVAGIREVAPRSSKDWLPELTEEIINSKGSIDICTIGMPAIINSDGPRNALLQRAQRYDIRVLLLDPDCEEADRRAKIEHPLGRKTINDIKATISWLKDKMAKNGRFRVHLYQLPPMLSLFITSDHIYVEPYHFGRPDDVEGCIGGKVPNLKIKNEANNSTAFFKAHFEYLWKDTRGGRLNLTFKITDYLRGSHIKIINNNDINIIMDGWVLAAHGVQKSLKFDPEFEWKSNEEITINIGSKRGDQAELFWDIKDINNQTIFTMQNANNITVAQWSPEIDSQSSCQ